MEGLLRRAAVRLLRPELRPAARGGGIQWPCTAAAPTAPSASTPTARFNTDPDHCETFGHDLATGAEPTPRSEYRAKQPARPRLPARRRVRALARDARRRASRSLLTTGRTVYQFHTRTKTGRAPELDAAAPEPWVELHPEDAAPLGIGEGDLVRVESPRGAIEAPARHRRRSATASCSSPSTTATGTWRRDRARGAAAAANELTDDRLGPGLEAADVQGRRRPAFAKVREATDAAPALPRPAAHARDHLARRSARSATPTPTSPTSITCPTARRAVRRARRPARALRRPLRRARPDEPERLHSDLSGVRDGPPGPGARPARPLPHGHRVRHLVDAGRPGRAGSARPELLDVVRACEGETSIQLAWLRTRLKAAAPQALVAAT